MIKIPSEVTILFYKDISAQYRSFPFEQISLIHFTDYDLVRTDMFIIFKDRDGKSKLLKSRY